jgi:CxxC motif-containing protein (DUF1111 family)
MHILLLGLFLTGSFGLWANEELPGGEGTTDDFSVQAFSHPLSGARSQLRRDFNVGNSFFNHVWVSSPSSTTARDGLGPLYNAVSCSSCHFKDGRGRGLPEASGNVDVSLLFRLRVNGSAHPVYGGQFQPHGVNGIQGEGEVRVSYKQLFGLYNDGSSYELAKPIYDFVNLNFGALGSATVTSPRVAPQMIGLGLVESISEEDILKNEDPYDADGDGISGRANWVGKRLGRFGWKAGKPSLLEQNAAAFNGDIGITSQLFPKEECTNAQTDCLKGMSEEDIPIDRLNLVTTYTRLLAPPKRREYENLSVKKGQESFKKANCIACHVPQFTTKSESDIDLLASQTIYPYSDFLLHDMGSELSDSAEVSVNEEQATTREWRTPPLWGLGLVPTVNGHTRYLHDGRARNLEEAILWHGGEALKAKEAFLNLSREERDNLIKFLKDL